MHGQVNQKVGESNSGFYSPCQSNLGQDTGPQVAPDASISVCERERVWMLDKSTA